MTSCEHGQRYGRRTENTDGREGWIYTIQPKNGKPVGYKVDERGFKTGVELFFIEVVVVNGRVQTAYPK